MNSLTNKHNHPDQAFYFYSFRSIPRKYRGDKYELSPPVINAEGKILQTDIQTLGSPPEYIIIAQTIGESIQTKSDVVIFS